MNILLEPLAQAKDEKQFGGKAKGLAWLTTQDCCIPAGVVIPVAVFDAHIQQLGLADTVAEMLVTLTTEQSVDNAACNALQTALKQAPLPQNLQAELETFWQQHKHVHAFAVRSSAPGEDGQAASFAGQFDSVLNIDSYTELQQAIQQVWASVFNPHALQYGQHQQRPLSNMAVVIQQQVDAALSGVLFTQHPAGCADEMLLEYCEGLGDKLVAGEITPVSVVALKHPYPNPSPSKGEGLKNQALAPPRPMRERGLGGEGVSFSKLTQTAQSLEKITGYPLDIEWCIDNNQQLYFLQCRPMTKAGQQTPAPTADKTELWSNANIAENFPEPVVPLLASFVPRGYAGYFRGLGEAFGIDRAYMNKAADSFNGLVGIQAGRLYYNLSQIFTVIHLVPGGAWLAQSFNLFTGAQGAPSIQQFRQPWYQQLWQAAKIAVQVPHQFLRVQQRVGEFEQLIDSYAARTQPDTLTQQSTVNLASHLSTFLDIRENRWRNAALADTAAMVCYAALKALIQRWLPDSNQAQLHNDLLQGLPGLASARPVEELWQLSSRIRQHPQTMTLFSTKSADEILQALPTQAPDIQQALQEYLQQWGFRYSGELMLTQATPAEQPEPVIQMLQSYLRDDGIGPTALSAKRATQRAATTESIAEQLTPSKLLRRLPLPSKARLFKRLVRSTHGAIRLRERARMKQALLYTRLRHVCLALGEQLTQLGWLKQREDIFYLAIDDAIVWAKRAALHTQQDENTRHIPAITAEEIQQLQTDIAKQRAELTHNLTLNPPEQMALPSGVKWQPGMSVEPADTAPHSSPATTGQNTANTLNGMSACGGSISGHAAVLSDATQMDKLQKGNILVTRQTDPGWAPVFFLVKGLVIERGGMLSHGAIIAREYGIPAVVGVAQATQLVKDGEYLTVDGTHGQVIRHDMQQTSTSDKGVAKAKKNPPPAPPFSKEGSQNEN